MIDNTLLNFGRKNSKMGETVWNNSREMVEVEVF